MNETRALAAFASISNETRLRIVKLLISAGAEGMAAGDIARAMNASPSRTSFHLADLTEAGLILPARKARRIVYAANFEAMGSLINYLIEDCCGSHQKVLACCGPVAKA